ncbi:MAG TPA: OB-fold domain-containing protein [Mycobacteriales bacterium]|nr:OB-fold domain-containing protein [Mycobacteriales bacterium]
MPGITGYATYVPCYRLDRGEAAAAVGEKAKGARAVAGYDEDTTSMAVEAVRPALLMATGSPDAVWFATTDPAYVDKTNATTVHAALGLPGSVGAFDLGASVRSGAAALLAAAKTSGVAALSDIRGGLAGGADERTSGDAAAAFVFGDTDVVAELVATASVSEEFLDRWRIPGETGSRTWEERFGEGEYVKLADHAVADVLKAANLAPGDVDAVGVAGPNLRAVKVVAGSLAKQTGATGDSTDLLDLVGNAGAAHVGLVLADLLDKAGPNQLLLLLSLADGADAFLFRTTERLPGARGTSLRDGLAATRPLLYPTYLLWRGLLDREPPRRPDPVRPSAPYAGRNADYKFAFSGGTCRACGTIQFPLPRVCLRCRAVDQFDPISGAGLKATIVTYTVDRLAFSPSPPLVCAVLDLEVGGRVQIELTDVDPAAVKVGQVVQLTFRRLLTMEGIHNYFWKARPVSTAEVSA